MAFILDASVTINWVMQDEGDPCADTALSRIAKDRAIVPAIWWYEVRNVLKLNERRRRITSDESKEFLESLEQFSIRIEFPHDSNEILRLADAHKLSVYDAAYLVLAKNESVPLATLDDALSAAARTEGVELIG